MSKLMLIMRFCYAGNCSMCNLSKICVILDEHGFGHVSHIKYFQKENLRVVYLK